MAEGRIRRGNADVYRSMNVAVFPHRQTTEPVFEDYQLAAQLAWAGRGQWLRWQRVVRMLREAKKNAPPAEADGAPR